MTDDTTTEREAEADWDKVTQSAGKLAGIIEKHLAGDRTINKDLAVYAVLLAALLYDARLASAK